MRQWLGIVGLVAVLVLVTLTVSRLTAPGRTASPPRPATGASQPRDEADPPAVAIGERLFLETRFSQFFFARSRGDANAELAAGDPVVSRTLTVDGTLPGPFAGGAMNCRSCHLVGELASTPKAGSRAYTDFASRSPIPDRHDGRVTTARNAPAVVSSTLPRPEFLLHFDGEFTSAVELIRETLLGRNFGWLPTERPAAIRHIAHIVRSDDGRGALARAHGGAYATLLGGVAPSIPSDFRLPAAFRLDVASASDERVVDAVAALIDAYVESLVFGTRHGRAGHPSPFDVFIARNQLSAALSGDPGGALLRDRLEHLAAPSFVDAHDGRFRLHAQPFVFGPLELRGLEIFLTRPARLPPTADALRRGGTGNCVACHRLPSFTDFEFHNTGAAQGEYDAIHGEGAFAGLSVPRLDARNARFEDFLPPTSRHPHGRGPFLSVPDRERPGRTDLGLWNVFANPDLPGPQARIRAMLAAAVPGGSTADLLDAALGRFKTPGLRDLGHSAPYLHTGRALRLEDVLAHYVEFSTRARAGTARNVDRELAGVSIGADDLAALAAFLRSLNEDYE